MTRVSGWAAAAAVGMGLMVAGPAVAADKAAPERTPYVDEHGWLNPEQGGITRLEEMVKERPERAGFICWQAYLIQKGGYDYYKIALDAFEDCAQAGNAHTMIQLAHMYENGHGAEKSPEMSTHWVRKSAESGYSLGQYHYGMALLTGYGVAADPEAAQQWLRKAADGGIPEALDALEDAGM